MHPTQIHINSKQLLLNLHAIRQQIGPYIKLCLPVKANAYGHGLSACAKLAAAYVDYFGVACLDEGVLLRKNHIHNSILVFGGFSEEQIPGLVANDLEISISSQYKAELVAKYCQATNTKCKVQIKIDTGMNRVGVRPESAFSLIKWVLANPNLTLSGVYSHLAASDDLSSDLTKQQIEKFSGVAKFAKEQSPQILCHLANSGGVCYFPASYFDMVRPGILSYGYFPAQLPGFPALQQIKPCFSLLTKVVYFKVVQPEQGISYNHQYITRQESRVVTLPIGYGDGYRRGLSNTAEVIIRGHKYRIAGNICMDMLMVDMAQGEAYVGDEVVLIGQQGTEEILITELAVKLHTIVYEILVGFNERIPRVYSHV